MKSGALLQVHREDELCRLNLNRPERHNALVPELLQALLTELDTLSASPPRALILAANGRSFSTGGDLREFWEQRDSIGAYAHRLVGLLNQVILALRGFPAPVICAVNGIVCGGSLGLLLASDIVLLSERATITPYYGQVGFSPDGGWTALLPQVIGSSRVAELLFDNASLEPGEAVARGLASRIDPQPLEAAHRLGSRFGKLEAGSARTAKQLLNGDLDAVAARLERERETFVAQAQTPEALAGIRRFLRIQP
ncbi:MAG: enoyl-CoA hydratase/isomerase family protein [Xanthomonadales bacterium]|nr:enoyl-CoA hydratase/isomerase family protein [Xanthomonadales bacterium]